MHPFRTPSGLIYSVCKDYVDSYENTLFAYYIIKVSSVKCIGN